MNEDIREKIFAAICRERDYQDRTWGTVEKNGHTIDEWIQIMLDDLRKAFDAMGDEHALSEILRVIAVGVACLEQHGIVERGQQWDRGHSDADRH